MKHTTQKTTPSFSNFSFNFLWRVESRVDISLWLLLSFKSPWRLLVKKHILRLLVAGLGGAGDTGGGAEFRLASSLIEDARPPTWFSAPPSRKLCSDRVLNCLTMCCLCPQHRIVFRWYGLPFRADGTQICSTDTLPWWNQRTRHHKMRAQHHNRRKGILIVGRGRGLDAWW